MTELIASTVRMVEITPSITIMCSVERHVDGRTMVMHKATHTVCYGDTEEDAIDTTRQTLLDDWMWYCCGKGATMIGLTPAERARRDHIWQVFGCERVQT